MRSSSHFIAYHATRVAAKCLLGSATRIRVLHQEKSSRSGPFILAANHISHFDPPIIAAVMHRKVDWMAMAEFFPHPVLGRILRAIESFPADRDRANRATIRTAISRLKKGRIVGMFPEGGIRDGDRSVLEGGALRPGVSALAHMAGVPIVPCVVLGSDRLYATRSWIPFRRTPIWIGFGDAIHHTPEMARSLTRARAEEALAFAFQRLYAEMRQQFCLTPDDLPQPPRARMSP